MNNIWIFMDLFIGFRCSPDLAVNAAHGNYTYGFSVFEQVFINFLFH